MIINNSAASATIPSFKKKRGTVHIMQASVRTIRNLFLALEVSAIAPNYIHSHDALVLHTVVNEMQASMRLTHDCFACVPGKVRNMQSAINNAYITLFGDNRIAQLEELQKKCLKDTGELIELPKEYRSEGIKTDEIEKAKYAFS